MSNQTTPDFGDIKVMRSAQRAATPGLVNQGAVGQPVVPNIVQPQIKEHKAPWIARFWWLPLLAVAGIAAAMWGHNYYNQRYVGSDYWAQVPATQDTTLVESFNANGQPTGMFGVHYFLNAFNETGEWKEVDFVFYSDDEASVPQPGEYLWISASPTIVVRQHVVSDDEVPARVRELIAAHSVG
jgi:uncharacterized protein YxeA